MLVTTQCAVYKSYTYELIVCLNHLFIQLLLAACLAPAKGGSDLPASRGVILAKRERKIEVLPQSKVAHFECLFQAIVRKVESQNKAVALIGLAHSSVDRMRKEQFLTANQARKILVTYQKIKNWSPSCQTNP